MKREWRLGALSCPGRASVSERRSGTQEPRHALMICASRFSRWVSRFARARALVALARDTHDDDGSLRRALLGGLYHFPDARGRKRKLARLHVEGAERIGDRIGHDAAGRDDATLAGALGAERVDRGGGILQHDGADVREVIGGRDKIVGERAGQELALLVVDKMLHHGTAQSLHRRAYGLAMHSQRIDDATAILDDDIVDELHVTELRVDRHM